MEGKASYMQANGKYLGINKDGTTIIMRSEKELEDFLRKNNLKKTK
tara:strand:+ start:1259 stop:1396 length:138 start_codon:yes stop_codon:yes gene_type:complete